MKEIGAQIKLEFGMDLNIRFDVDIGNVSFILVLFKTNCFKQSIILVPQKRGVRLKRERTNSNMKRVISLISKKKVWQDKKL